jgi:Rrf2 family protein
MISSRARYATRALLDLSLRPEGLVLIGDIATRQNIPLKYLQQILVALKQAGFIRSRKGPGGGVVLARPPEAITLGELIRAIDDPFSNVGCLGTDCGCPDPDTCPIRESFQDVREAIDDILNQTTFADLRDRYRTLNAIPLELNFVI